MTPYDFVTKYTGQNIDFDAAYGVQCVDGFKVFCQWAGIPVKATPNNWANGYWIYRDELGFSKFFDYIEPSQIRNGDWCIWDKGSSCPLSHISMYYEGKFFGERQITGDTSFSLVSLQKDIMGALRWKGWTDMDEFKYGINYRTFEDADLVIYKGPDEYELYMLSAGENNVQDIQDFDDPGLLIVAATNANYFQMRTDQPDPYGTHYGVEQTYNGVDLAPKQDGLLCYYRDLDGRITYLPSSHYWHTQKQVQFACTPYSVLIHDNQVANSRSTDLGNKEGTKATQTMIARVNDHWFIICCRSNVLPSVMLRYAQKIQASEAILMDSGGSTQLMAFNGTKYEPEIYTGRHIPNVFVIAKPKAGDFSPIQPGTGNGEQEPTPVDDEPGTGGNEETDVNNNVTKTLLPDRVYDVLKWVALIALPALAVFVLTMGTDLTPNYEVIAKFINGIAVLLGSLLGVSTAQYNRVKGGQDE